MSKICMNLTLLGLLTISASSGEAAMIGDLDKHEQRQVLKERKTIGTQAESQTCRTQRYSCGRGAKCELITTRDMRKANGQKAYAGGDVVYYTCSNLGTAIPAPTCSHGTPKRVQRWRAKGGIASWACGSR